MIGVISAEDRALFAAIADVLIPGDGRMPPASSVDVAGAQLDFVLTHRPDLAEPIHHGLALVRGMGGPEAAEHLFRSEGPAFDAIGLAASGGYFAHPAVREAIGYPGQESLLYDPFALPEYVSNGMLDRVVKRGKVYRDVSDNQAGG